MFVGVGSNSFVVSEVHLMIFLSRVVIAMLVNITANIAMIVIEQNPPVEVLKSDSPLYLMNWDTEKRSHMRRRDCSPLMNLLNIKAISYVYGYQSK